MTSRGNMDDFAIIAAAYARIVARPRDPDEPPAELPIAPRDLSPRDRIMATMVKLRANDGRYTYLLSDIVRKATSTISPKSDRRGTYGDLAAAVRRLAADPKSGVYRIRTGTNASNEALYAYGYEPPTTPTDPA